jgi:Helix-turn-helix domain
MGENDNQPHRSELRLRGALMHPARIGILDYLATNEDAVGEDELAAALDLTGPQVKYHLGELDHVDLISQVDDEWARKAAGRFYVAAVLGQGEQRDA